MMKIKALKDIHVNDEITISYIDSKDKYKQRQKDLMKEYHFVCECFKCTTEKPVDMTVKTTTLKVEQLSQMTKNSSKLRTLRNKNDKKK